MMHIFRLMAAIAVAGLLAGGPAAAATTVYPVGHFSNSGIANPNRLLGNNPNTNNIARNASIGLYYGADISRFVISFVITAVSPQTTYIWLRAGRISGATYTNATAPGLLAPNGTPTANLYIQISGPGTYWLSTAAFGPGCAALGGCNAIVFGNSMFSQAGSTFQLSMVGATPEPRVWALMILGFVGVAARLKQVRRPIQRLAPAPA